MSTLFVKNKTENATMQTLFYNSSTDGWLIKLCVI